MRGDRRGRKLQRLILAREAKTGAQIMRRMGGDAEGRRYLVSLPALRQHLPELFAASSVDDLQKSMRRFLADIDDRIAGAVAEHVSAQVDPKITELWERDETIAKNVKQLGERVRDLAGMIAPKKSA